MSAPELPLLTEQELAAGLAPVSPEPLDRRSVQALFAHYQELRRWNRRLSLIGPGSVESIFTRHYGESLAALPLLPPGPGTLLDVGSGAGFPGFVLAATRADLQAVLVEPRQRKCAFLRSAARRAALPCRCLDARVTAPLPPGLPLQLDALTIRALKLPPAVLEALAGRLSPGGRMLLWVGADAPAPPAGLVRGAEIPLAGSSRRRIVELRRGEGGGAPERAEGT